MKILNYNLDIKKIVNDQSLKKSLTGNTQSKNIRQYVAARNKVIRPISVEVLQKAIDRARDIQTPNRSELYQLYQTCIDFNGRLPAVMRKMKLQILEPKLEAIDINGQRIEAETQLLHKSNFNNFLIYLLESIDWGFSYGQIMKINPFYFEKCERENFDPVTMEYKQRPTDMQGVEWDSFKNAFYYGDGGLGLLLYASLMSIHKINCVADWAGVIEKYSYPIEKVTYEGNDPEIKKELSDGLYNQGSNANVEVPAGVSIDYVFPDPSGDLQDNFVKMANEEIAIIFLGNTMTTENGSSQAQATVHADEQEMIINYERNRLIDYLNSDFKKYWVEMGLVSCQKIRFTEKQTI